jgi:hypothetical protein
MARASVRGEALEEDAGCVIQRRVLLGVGALVAVVLVTAVRVTMLQNAAAVAQASEARRASDEMQRKLEARERVTAAATFRSSICGSVTFRPILP